MFVIKLLVTSGLLAAVFYQIDRSKLSEIVVQSDSLYIFLSILLYAMTFVAGGIRWRVINTSLGCLTPLSFNIKYFFISGFFSQLVVGGGYGGDVYRIWALAKASKNNMLAVASVFIDRLSGLMLAVILVGIFTPVYSVLLPNESILVAISMSSILVVVTFFAISLVGQGGVKYRAVDKFSNLKYVQRFIELAEDIANGFLNWPVTLYHLLWSFVALLLNLLALSMIGVAIGVDVEFQYFLLLGPIVFLAKSFPLSIAGWGA